MIAGGAYSGEKLEALSAAIEQAKTEQAAIAENGELHKAYDAAAALDERIFDMKPVLYGDVNGDGDVRINDVILLQKHLAGYEVNLSRRQLEAAAVVSDGEPTVNDVTQIQKYLAEIVPSLTR
jgi:hypothetical protein